MTPARSGLVLKPQSQPANYKNCYKKGLTFTIASIQARREGSGGLDLKVSNKAMSKF
jgi:hypothetical protein